jgi:hypothetical protein
MGCSKFIFAQKINKIHEIEETVLGSQFNFRSHVVAEYSSPKRLLEIFLNFCLLQLKPFSPIFDLLSYQKPLSSS